MEFLRGRGRAARLAGRVLVLGLALSGAMGAQEAQPPDVPRSPGLERAMASPSTPLELRRRLASLDAAELPGLFHLAAEGSLPGQPTRPALADAERALVREALAARPRREIVPFLEDLASRPLGPSLRLEAQALLGKMGAGEHIKLLARLTSPFKERGTVAPALRAGFSAALGAILARDASGLAQIPLLISESPPGLASSIVEALAGSPAPAATRVLASLLGRTGGLDPLLLTRLAERPRPRSGGDESVLEGVRRYLRQRDPTLVSAAALAAGQLGDDGSVEALIGLIDHPDERVRDSVFLALERITGLAFGVDAARWAAWHNAEVSWWDEEADSLLVRIERGRGLDFARAAREVLEHRLFHDRIAESFAHALQRQVGEELRNTCRALERLRSYVAVPALVECLERDDAGVREAAWRALRAITGVELPPEADSWAALASG